MRAIAVLLVSGLLLSANRADAQTLTTGKAGGLPKAIRKITEAIDKHLAADWAERNITPAAVTDDAEFCRRVFLDILGRIPKPMEVRDFEDDKAADKRMKLVDKLLSKPGYAAHQASHFRTQWLPETITDAFKFYTGEQFEAMLKKRLAKDLPMDTIVSELLTVPVTLGPGGMMNFNPDPNNQDVAGMQAFYSALEAKPENLGATVSRAFLGVKLECAQCHDHPFAPYKREQFWNFAAFFGEFIPQAPPSPSFVGPIEPHAGKNKIKIPGLEKIVVAKFADGTEPDWIPTKTPRQELAEWVASSQNPYFAKNIVNRMWQQYFGVGPLDPIDEPGDGNPPSHPKLLNELARCFLDADCDLKTLIRGMTMSKAYQLSSKQSHPSQGDPRRFARMNLKGMTGSQIYESFVTATGMRMKQQDPNTYYETSSDGVSRFAYRNLFPTPSKPMDVQTSILQALTVMNGKLMADQTSLDKSTLLAAVADAPFFDTAKKVEALYYAAFGRAPTAEEAEKFTSYVERGGPSGDKGKALGDVFWVLLNSAEFLFNH